MGSNAVDDCSLTVRQQNRNILCFTIFWASYYLAAPISYVGVTHANLLKYLGNRDVINNLPSAIYQWLTIVPVMMAWFFPRPQHLKPLALSAIGCMVAATAGVAGIMMAGFSARVVSSAVVGHAAVFGACSGVLLTSMWDFLRRGVATSRRGKTLGWTFGAGPLFACAGALVQDTLFGGQLTGFKFNLLEPYNYAALFALAAPVILVAGAAVILFTLPETLSSTVESSDLPTTLNYIMEGTRQFFTNRPVWFAICIYVIVYSGGNSIFSNVSLYAKEVLGENTETQGLQNFLRFGFKSIAGALLGWLLASASPRATLLATTSVLLFGLGWAMGSSGWWFLLTSGILGAGELFGAYFPNYVTTASEKRYVRINMAYLSVLSTLIGFSSVGFGWISDHYGTRTSFVVAAALLVCGLLLIGILLPANPAQRLNHQNRMFETT